MHHCRWLVIKLTKHIIPKSPKQDVYTGNGSWVRRYELSLYQKETTLKYLANLFSLIFEIYFQYVPSISSADTIADIVPELHHVQKPIFQTLVAIKKFTITITQNYTLKHCLPKHLKCFHVSKFALRFHSVH